MRIDRAAIEQKIVEVVRAKFGGEPTPPDSLYALGADSLAMAELVAEFESEWDLQIDEGLFEVETIRELAEYLLGKIEAAEG